jgi:hypothetical protein
MLCSYCANTKNIIYHFVPHFGVARRSLRRSAKIVLGQSAASLDAFYKYIIAYIALSYVILDVFFGPTSQGRCAAWV